MMTDNDRRLIELAYGAGSDYEYVDSLIPGADTEECRERLRDISHWAFKEHESCWFDREIGD